MIASKWSRPGARASYELDTPEHRLKIFAVEGEGASANVLSTPGEKHKPPRPLNLLKFKNDKFTGIESISFQQPIQVTPGMTLDLSAARREGQHGFADVPLSFHFVQTGEKRWQFSSFRTFVVLVDGSRSNMSEPTYRGDVIGTNMSTAYALEQMTVDVDNATFIAIARAKTVEARLGAVEFKMSFADRAAMRQLADELTKESQESTTLSSSGANQRNVTPSVLTGGIVTPTSPAPQARPSQAPEFVPDGGEAP